MAWFLLARLLFTGAVVYSAFLLQPLGPQPAANLLFGFGLALLAVVFEWQLRETPVTHMAGALVGGARRPGARQGHRRRAVLGRPGRPAGGVPAQLRPAGRCRIWAWSSAGARASGSSPSG